MTILDGIILGMVEGLTEFLPVSSTGHLILTRSLLGLEGRAVDSYLIVIQAGAILSVLALYRHRALSMLRGVLGRDAAGLRLFLRLLVAFIPAVFAGLLLEDFIERLLFGPWPVAVALVLGGVVMIAADWWRGGGGGKSVEDVTVADAALIGVAQCFALWPGMSRSMCTIVGGQVRGLSRAAAAEFSFLLALPTLGAATAYKLLKDGGAMLDPETGIGLGTILVGEVVAFVVALLAMQFFVRTVTRFGMVPWAIYRIVVGLLFIGLLAAGVIAAG